MRWSLPPIRFGVAALLAAATLAAVPPAAALAATPATATAEPAHTSAWWTTTWASAQAAAVPNVTTGLPGLTIRNVVHPTVPGSLVRVHLSNRFGTAPVLMAHVTVAVSAHAGGKADGTIDNSDGSARPGTLRHVLFSGRRTVTIPAGGEVVSDGVALTVPADRDLLVTTWTPNPSGTVTYHPAAQQTSFFNDDRVDHSADLSAAAVPKQTNVWHYLSGVDVLGGPGTVVVLGDSITDGVTSTWGANRRWTDYLAQRLNSQFAVPRYGIANAGISGNRILLDGGAPNYTIFHSFGKSALARYDWDVLDRSGARSVILFEGINDIQQTPNQHDPAQIIAGLNQLVSRAHARGLRVTGATIMPWFGWGSYTDELERVRQAVNTWIRTAGVVDAVADLDAATRDPADPRRMRPAYDVGDHLHPNDAGDKAMAAAVNLARL
jgi:lysophospholipase L1-like esterase